ncbi:TraB/GumN family protein [Duganella qianjiadongensis]|uniref:TraB/GumN family protein n=1 Tax=Duganella qianjiadongensis TaxID=2692176 RepID=A0ABW9VRT4_9BURK|nr:TraB/GumN family protein [Duganella qianjiadongensis]MYM40562.1 TraB/GumN family protein [Duganella qianjiadongensis]
MKLTSLLTALAFCFAVGAAGAQEVAPESDPEAGQVLVLGQRPGPGMWQVSKDDHVLWVFGKYGPLPSKMEWRSHEVEAVLAKAGEYLAEPEASARVGIWGGIKLAASLPQIWDFQKNPDGAVLKDVVPPETYQRWAALKDKFMRKDEEVERYRPIFAANKLYASGLQHIGLSNKDEVGPAIDKLVKRYKLKVTPATVEIDMSDASKLIKEFSKSGLDDAACFSSILARLEADIDHMRVRANAWAIGDIEKIRKLDYTDHEGACRAAIENSAAFQSRSDLREARAKTREMWLHNAQQALENNATTFAMLPLKEILSPTGLLARLQTQGYKVVAPE